MSHARTKATKLAEAKRLYFLAPHGLTDIELADQLGIDRSSAYRYRKELRAVEVSEGRYTLTPTQDDIDLALAILQRVHQ
jgi:DNA-binding IclR family transcriptional regulator